MSQLRLSLETGTLKPDGSDRQELPMAMRDIHMQLPEERIEDFERIQELVEYRTKAEVVASAGRLVRHICEEIYKARRTGDNLQLCLVKNRNADEVKRINSSFLDRIR